MRILLRLESATRNDATSPERAFEDAKKMFEETHEQVRLIATVAYADGTILNMEGPGQISEIEIPTTF